MSPSCEQQRALNAEDGALLEAVRSIRWPARRRTLGGARGAHVSGMRGYSQEFTQYRAYRQGDDTRRLDWKVLARTDRPFLRLSNDRTLLATTILVDASASMAYPAATLEKWHYARQVAVGLAAAAHAGGDPVGLMALSTDTGEAGLRLPPRTRRSAVREIASVLGELTPSGALELAPLLGTLRNCARVAIVADFLGDTPALLEVAGRLSAGGNEVHAVHVIHEEELDPPMTTTLLVDPERTDLRRRMTEATRRQYLENFSAWREGLARDWRMQGAWFTPVVTSEPVAHAVRKVTIGGALARSP